jgi:hypothetical protein
MKKYRNGFCNKNQKHVKTEETMEKTEWFCEDEPIYPYRDEPVYMYIEVGNNNKKNKIDVGWHQCMTFI